MARRLTGAADRVVAVAGITRGTTVLDVGCGTGNAALAAARRGARVTGADPTPELLSVAEHRARAEGLTVSWRRAPADGTDGLYERVLSVFGAMYAPDPARTAAALLRCCAPGGRVVSAAWTPDGFMAATNRAMGAFLPPPPAGTVPPTRWGDASFVRGLFAGGEVAGVTAATEHVTFTFPSPSAAAEFWLRTAGHVLTERPRLEAEGRWAALHDAVAAVFAEWDQDTGPGIRVAAAYLLVVVAREPA
ncbi:class I SAM-dependent methyltransferase [Streptomyces pactum]|uniref:class I SAM-dependent methyltransferase n=1 Tax=Streptomyces pactum TaxID=68249 RepID=UPI0018D9B2E0|nr:class I SAM-dependent methyltransferase [Streptomyces pactum]